MPHAYLILPAIVGGGLMFGWIFARWLETRYDRGYAASSEELLDEGEELREHAWSALVVSMQ